eukprot:1183067-Prorocentrum_minimum.AAC.2
MRVIRRILYAICFPPNVLANLGVTPCGAVSANLGVKPCGAGGLDAAGGGERRGAVVPARGSEGGVAPAGGADGPEDRQVQPAGAAQARARSRLRPGQGHHRAAGLWE